MPGNGLGGLRRAARSREVLAGAVRGGAGVCGNAARAQQFSAEPPPPLPPRSVSSAPLRSPSRASAGRRHHGPVRHHLLQDRAGLPQPHLLGELAGGPGPGRPLRGAGGPGGRAREPAEGVVRVLQPRSPLLGSFPAPTEARAVQTGGLGASGLLARCQGSAGRRGRRQRAGRSALGAESVGTPGLKWDTPQRVGFHCLCLSPPRARGSPQVV